MEEKTDQMINIEKIKAAVAKLDCGMEKGTAFLISADTAITVSHCVMDDLEKDQEEIRLTFMNIPEKESFSVTAFPLKNEDTSAPICILKLDQKVETEYLKLAYWEDPLFRNGKLFTYGYPAAKREEGYPVDMSINDHLNKNVVCDYDIKLVQDPKSKLNDYSGMSGSPVVWKDYVIGVLTAESLEVQKGSQQVIDIGAISNKKALELYEKSGIILEKLRKRDPAEFEQRYNELKPFDSSDYGVACERRNYNEKGIIGQNSYEDIKEDLENSVKSEIDFIYQLKQEGRYNEAWKMLLSLTERVRRGKSKDNRLLAKLYYIRALWYLDDKQDCQNAQKYIQKVLDRCPEYDCRTYYARKYYLEGNVIKEKEILLPIDTVSVLNTYLQICVQKNEIEEAMQIYQTHKNLEDHNTHYLMALVYILDHEYDMAEEYLDKALCICEKSPMYIMMKGIIKYWKIVPLNISKEGEILPVMYNTEIVPDDRMTREIEEITKIYERASVLAKEAKNNKMYMQILGVWLCTLSISQLFRTSGKKVAEKLLEIDSSQHQAIFYLYAIGENLSKFDAKEIESKIKNSENPMEYILACVYVALGKQEKELAYKVLKRYEYEFKRLNMLDLWFELIIKSSNTQEQQQDIWEKLEESSLETVTKMRLQGMLLEAMNEEEKLLSLTKDIYQQTGQEIDVINLVHCSEKFGKWEDVEKYSGEWRDKFSNLTAETTYIRSIAMQNRQKECLAEIQKLREDGKEEYITDEVRFWEAQALKLLGRLEEAIPIAEELWENTTKQSVLILLAECYFLNGAEQDMIDILKEGTRKGFRTAPIYQMLAEHERYYSVREAIKHAKKACDVSDHAQEVLLWAMHFFYEIGESDTANEILVKLRNMNQLSCFRMVSFKEVKKIMEEAKEREQELFDQYRNVTIPYHLYVDARNNASYALMCMQRWNENRNKKKKFPVYMSFGGHSMMENNLENYYGKDIVMDFSSLFQIQHLGFWEEMKQCWKHVYISCDINRVLAFERRNCSSNQPDVTDKELKMMEEWKRQDLKYLSVPVGIEIEPDQEPGDWIPYQIAKEKNLFWVNEHFLSDLMENPDIVSEEMRLAAISPIEALTALEKRGEISTTFKNRYLEQSQIIREEVIDRLLSYQGKLPLLVDQNFLREIYELDGVSIIAQKCNIFVLEVAFDNIENEQKNVKIGQETIQLLDNMRDTIFDEKEQGFIRLYERYLGNERNDKEVHTAALLDELHFAMENDTAFFCDDRMVTCYSHMGKAGIYNVTDFIEFVHEKGIITDEKYVNVVTRMIQEGYSFMLPPYTYMKILLFQTNDTAECIQQLPAELEGVCDYLQDITVSEGKMMNHIVGGETMPESIAFMCRLQNTFMKLLQEVWKSSRTLEWKRNMSTWLVMNFSEFGYDFYFFELGHKDNQHYKALELANFLFTGLDASLDKSFQRDYYDWLFGWMSPYFYAEEGMEKKTIDCFAGIIDGTYTENSSDHSCEIGIGAYVKLATEDMPDYYAEKVRSHAKIRPLLEQFESSFILLDHHHLIERSVFFDWLEAAMMRGMNHTVQITYRKEKYEITWLTDDMFMQGFKICWKDSDNQEKAVYYKVEGALLECGDKLLRMKGFSSIRDYLNPEHVKKYEIMMNQPERLRDNINSIFEEVRNKDAYWKHLIHIFAEKTGIEIYSLEDIFPNNGTYFEGCTIDFPKAYYDDSVQWCRERIGKTRNPLLLFCLLDIGLKNHIPEVEQIFCELTNEQNILWYQIYIELVCYSYRTMKSRNGYAGYDKNEIVIWSYYYAGLIIDIIADCERNGTLKWSLKSLYSGLKKRNADSQDNSFWDIDKKVSEPSELSYARLIMKPVCKIINRYEGKQISKEKIENWLIHLEKKRVTDLEVFKESVLCNRADEDDSISRILSGNLLDEIITLKTKYDIARPEENIKSSQQLFIKEISNQERLSENEFALLVILSQETFPEEWVMDIENAIRKFPYKETTDNDGRIVMCICVILRRLRKEFVNEYLPVLKKWVKEQLIQEQVSNEDYIMSVMEYISALENPDELVDCYIKLWQEILKSGTKIKVSRERIELLRKLTMMVTMQQAKELRKVINVISEV